MKSLFKTTYPQGIFHVWLLIFRVAISIFMITHGYGKLKLLLSGGGENFLDPIGVGPVMSLYMVVFAEFVCSIFLILGLATRFVVIPLIVTMAVAAFVFHGADPFAAKELSLIYLIFYITLLITGGGKFSIDHYIKK
ncbi:MAG: DoxX family protein [Bacteroidales bacterium]|nr:DoxX family protein [Bacteroidales bacterium]